MFEKAIEEVSHFTRPIYFVERTNIDNNLTNGSATMFFVNEFGHALTCKHVVMALIDSIELDKKYIENKLNYKKGQVIERKFIYPGSVDKFKEITFIIDKEYDLALIKFSGFDKLLYKKYAKFIQDSSKIKQGQFVCKIGFPFPEFNNFEYNQEIDHILFNNKGRESTPIFPLEGMITRFVGKENEINSIETSSPGLKGQSGGPLFDKDGVILGMQSLTKHLHLGFDIEDKKIITKEGEKHVSNYQFINLGESIHVDIIKKFLISNNIKFYTK